MAAVMKYFTAAAAPFHSKRTGREEAQARAACTSRTIYIGNLAFTTTDAQVHALFSRAGAVERVIMGINRMTMKPCGFAFVIFMDRPAVVAALTTLDGTLLDDRIIRVEADKGFYEGRQYGRGSTGAQVRDEMRADYDEGRGGYGLGIAAGDGRRSSGGRYSGGRGRGNRGLLPQGGRACGDDVEGSYHAGSKRRRAEEDEPPRARRDEIDEEDARRRSRRGDADDADGAAEMRSDAADAAIAAGDTRFVDEEADDDGPRKRRRDAAAAEGAEE